MGGRSDKEEKIICFIGMFLKSNKSRNVGFAISSLPFCG